MFGNNRKTIGVFLCRTGSDYQSRLCQAIATEGEKRGYNIAFFTSIGMYGDKIAFALGEKQIINLPHYEKLDGIITAGDTLDIENMAEEITDLIDSYAKCPVVNVRNQNPKYRNITIDNYQSMKTMMKYVIEQCKCKNIYYMSGPKTYEDAMMRLKAYRDAMAEYKLPCNEGMIYMGDYWKNKGEDCAKWLCSNTLPEALVCANDYMALSVIHALKKLGVEVPRDILVTGFDNVLESCLDFPSLTTMEMPIELMGEEAVRLIDDIILERDVPGDVKVPTKLISRESSGSRGVSQKERESYISEIVRRWHYEQHISQQNMFMGADLADIISEGQIYAEVRRYIDYLDDYKSFFICLCDSSTGLTNEYSENMTLRYCDMGHSEFGEVKLSFSRVNLLPSMVTGENPQIFFFIPLHYKDQCLGYASISFRNRHSLEQSFQFFITNLCNALGRVLHYASIMKNEDTSNRDQLTGLFNRYGFENFVERNTGKKCGPFGVLSIDMDGLKMINDHYGHAEGDRAIRAITEAINFAAKNNEMCIRFGGDEFVVLGSSYDDEKMKQFIKNFEYFIWQYNNASIWPYLISASHGYAFAEHAEDIEEALRISDKEMYQQKLAKKNKELE